MKGGKKVFSKLVLSIVVFAIINIGSFVRLQIFQNSISWKEFKVYMIIINVIYILFALLYIAGIIRV